LTISDTAESSILTVFCATTASASCQSCLLTFFAWENSTIASMFSSDDKKLIQTLSDQFRSKKIFFLQIQHLPAFIEKMRGRNELLNI
jgi:hypothetical protein